MQTKTIAIVLAGTMLAVLPGVDVQAAAARDPSAATPPSANYLSANIPLDSYVYDYLDKLDGLGYLREMRPSAKPYTRMQAAAWVQQIAATLRGDDQAPAYARLMLTDLESEFTNELAILDGQASADGLKLKEWRIEAGYYHGGLLEKKVGQPKTKYQPLNYNRDGFKYDQDLNLVTDLRLEGKTGDDLVVSMTPRFTNATDNQNDSALTTAYMKTHINNVEIQLGKDAVWWGPGQEGTLALSNNAEPQTGLVLRNLQPLRFNGILRHLGAITNTVTYSELEDARTDVSSPSFFGWRSDFIPNNNFTFAFARTSMVGGKGHVLNHGDYWDFLTGENAASDDKWNSIGGIDFRWRLPQLNGLQVYGEVYGEDQATAAGFIPTPSKPAYLAGAYLPRLTPSGDWDLTVEWARTSEPWYVHGLYTDGYTYKGDIIGDAMGQDASRYYAKLTHYQSNDTQISLNYQYITQNTASNPQTIDSAWLTWRRQLQRDYSLDASFGLARVENVSNQGEKTQHNYFTGLAVTRRY